MHSLTTVIARASRRSLPALGQRSSALAHFANSAYPGDSEVDSATAAVAVDPHMTGGALHPSVFATMRKEMESNPGSETPFYVVDLGEVRRMMTHWEDLFPRIKPFYAVKCNPDEQVVRTLAGMGASFDCASQAEMQLVERVITEQGGSREDLARRVIFANPCKPRAHIAHARDHGIDRMTFDSVDELRKMRALHPNARAVLRLLVDDSHARCRLGVKFGAPMDTVPALLQEAKDLGVEVDGFSFHVGSGSRDPIAFESAIRRARAAWDMAEDLGMRPRLLDIGGGFSGSRGAGAEEEGAALRDVAALVNPLLARMFPDAAAAGGALGFGAAGVADNRGLEFISEPGRYFVHRSHTLTTQVVGRRALLPEDGAEEPHVFYYVSDGVYGAFNCVMYDHAVVKPEVAYEAPLVMSVRDEVRQWQAQQAARASAVHAPPPGHGTVMENPQQRAARAQGEAAAPSGTAGFASTAGSPTPSDADAALASGVAGGRGTLRSTIYGPTCDGIDCVARNVFLPELAVGSWLYWPNMGAYTSAAAGTFNGFPVARKVYIDSVAGNH